MKVFPDAFILNDDKPAIRYENGVFYAYGTPFSGKTNLNKNEKYQIAGIAFLKRGENNSIKIINAGETITNFFSQTIRPFHEERLDQMTEILNLIIEKISIYELVCNMEDDAAILAYKNMKKE